MMSSSTDNIKVAIKARPLIQREVSEGLEAVWKIKNNSVYQTDEVGARHGDVYTFDHVFDQDCTNTNVYMTVGQPLVEAFMEGFNATIFAYGQTSSGKTHTILGNKTDDGLFHLIVKDIFNHVAAKVEKRYLIRCSYFEIYNEKINDLLEKNNQALSIREDTKGNMLLNAREAVVTNVGEALEKMKQGNKIRRIGATSMNERSSRSHTIFRIILESKDAKEEDGPVHISQLNLVDLAGSERVAQSKAAGQRLKEGVNINKSLSALGNVIRQLSEGQQFVNYRDSKLTRLLTQALGGNAKSLIITNITLAAGDETKSTLEFAQRAKNVKNKPEVNILSSRDEAIQEFQLMKHNLESRLKKQAEILEEMERHKKECLIEIERLKVEATIVGHFQSGASVTESQKPNRRHTIGDYGSGSSKAKPLKHVSKFGNSLGRDIETIHEESFEEALAEAELMTFEDVPTSVLKRQLKSLEQSYTELKEFTKLEKQYGHDEIAELKGQVHSAHVEISRLNEELETMRQLLDEQTKKATDNAQNAQDCVDLQFRLEFMEQKYKTTLTSYENEIESLRSQLEDLKQTESSQLKHEISPLEAKNIELTAKVSELEAIIDTEIEDKKDTLSAGTQTEDEETVKSLVNMEEELDFHKELVAKLKDDIRQLEDQSTKQELKYTFEISDMRSDNQTTVSELVEQNAQLEEQNEILSMRILEKEVEMDRLQIELEMKKKEMAEMNDLLLVETKEDVVKMIDAHMEKKRHFEEELARESQQYAEDFKCFMDAFVGSLREFRDSAKDEDKELLERYIALLSDESRDRFVILRDFLDETRGFSDLRYAKHMKKLTNMGNHWMNQEKIARERDLRCHIHREYKNLEYLNKLRNNLDYKSDTAAMIKSLEGLLDESTKQRNFGIADYEKQIQPLLPDNEKLNLEDQNQRLASQIELLEKKLVKSGDMELLKVTVRNLELENESLKEIVEKLRQQVADLEAVNVTAVEFASENETLRFKLREYDTSVADLLEITKEKDILEKHVKDLEKQLEKKEELESHLNCMTEKYNSLCLENEGLVMKIKRLEDELSKLKQSSDRVKALEETNANLKSDLEKSEKQQKELSNTYESMKERVVKGEDQIRVMEADNTRLKDLIAEKELTINKLNSDSNAVYEEINHLKDQLAKQERELNTAYCDIDVKLQETEELKSQIAGMERDIVDLRSTKLEVEGLRAELATKSDEIDSLRTQIVELASENETLRYKLREYDTSVADLLEITKERDILQKHVKDLKKELEKEKELESQQKCMTEKYNNLSLENEGLAMKIERLEGELSKLKQSSGRVQTLEEINANLKSDLEESGKQQKELSNTYESMKERVLKREDQIRVMEEEISRLKDLIAEKELTSNELNSDSNAVYEEINHLKDQLTKQERELNTAYCDIDVKLQETAELKSQIAEMERDIVDLRSTKSEVEGLRVELATKSEEIDSLRTQIVELASENETLRYKLREYDTSVADLLEITKERDILEKHVKDLKKELEKEKELESQQKCMTEKYNNLSLENEGLVMKIKRLEDELSKLKQSSDRVKALEETNANLKSDLEESEKQQKELSNTYESMKERVVKREDQIRVMEEDNTRLKDLIAEKERTINKLNSDSNAVYEDINHLKDQLAKQERELNTAYCDIDVKLQETAELKSQIAGMERDIVDLRSTKSEVEGLRVELATKSDEMDSLRTQIVELASENETLRYKLREYDTSVADLLEITKERDILEKHVKDLKKELEKEKELESQQKCMTEKYNNLSLENEGLAMKIERLEGELSKLKQSNCRVQTLEEINANLKSDLEESEKQQKELSNTYESMKEIVVKREDQIRVMEEENSRLKDLIAEKELTINKLNSDSNAVYEEINHLKDQLAKQEREFNTAYCDIDVKLQETAELKSQIAEMERDIVDLRSTKLEVEELRAELATKSDETDSLRTQIADWERKHKEAESKLDIVAKNAKDLQKHNSQLQSELEGKEQPNILKETFRRHKKKINDLNSENASLQEQIKYLQHRLDTLDSELVAAYQTQIQSLETDKMKLIQQVNDLESKIEDIQSHWETRSLSSNMGSATSIEQVAKTSKTDVSTKQKLFDSPLQFSSPDISIRELTKIKRYSLHDSRRGLTTEDEKGPVAGSSQEFAENEKQIDAMLSHDSVQKNYIKELEEEMKKLKPLISGPADLLTSEPLEYDHKSTLKEQITTLETEVVEKNRELENVKTDNASLQRANEASNQQLKKLLAELTDAKNVRSSYAQQLEAAKKEVKRLNGRLISMKNSNEDLQARISIVQGKLQLTETELSMKSKAMEHLELDVARLNSRLSDAKCFNDDKKRIDLAMELHKNERLAYEQQIQNLEKRLRDAEKMVIELEKKCENLNADKQRADENHKKSDDIQQSKIDKLKKVAQMRRKENLELRQHLGLGEEDPVPPLKK